MNVKEEFISIYKVIIIMRNVIEITILNHPLPTSWKCDIEPLEYFLKAKEFSVQTLQECLSKVDKGTVQQYIIAIS